MFWWYWTEDLQHIVKETRAVETVNINVRRVLFGVVVFPFHINQPLLWYHWALKFRTNPAGE